MDRICPYCGQECRALKNHVRLTSDDDHGPSGQYPEDFNSSIDSKSFDSKRLNKNNDDAENTVTDDTSETVNWSPRNSDDLEIKIEREEDEFRHIDSRVESEKPTVEEKGSSWTGVDEKISPENCPECGETLSPVRERSEFFTQEGKQIMLEDSDDLCLSCGLIVEDNGNVIHINRYGGHMGSMGGMILLGFIGLVTLVLSAVTEDNSEETHQGIEIEEPPIL
ncbi:hypothetical protein ACFQPA_11755 [Halomarina halobia]|uniref:C2H2-type domain-containing protein n=1 Tax=Halomarina halobia TaxID=3033386 RepID=A0ABD6A9K2_9EURY|nr:hypothetical protein [Halomarina sp. PSR21]